MIPKIIHYCWFGRGKKSKLFEKCIASWKKYCPDYKIIEWNEDNFDVNIIDYTKFAYNNQCYAYLSDYVRLWVIAKYGGIYFDTDVELIKNPDELLNYKAFFGFENESFVTTGLGFGAEPDNLIVIKMLEEYEKREPSIYRDDFKINHKMTGSPTMNTNTLIPMGLKRNGKKQYINGAIILPVDFLCPFDDITGELNCTFNTISIHWYGKSSNGRFAKIRSKLTRPIHRIFKKGRN